MSVSHSTLNDVAPVFLTFYLRMPAAMQYFPMLEKMKLALGLPHNPKQKTVTLESGSPQFQLAQDKCTCILR